MFVCDDVVRTGLKLPQLHTDLRERKETSPIRGLAAISIRSLYFCSELNACYYGHMYIHTYKRLQIHTLLHTKTGKEAAISSPWFFVCAKRDWELQMWPVLLNHCWHFLSVHSEGHNLKEIGQYAKCAPLCLVRSDKPISRFSLCPLGCPDKTIKIHFKRPSNYNTVDRDETHHRYKLSYIMFFIYI